LLSSSFQTILKTMQQTLSKFLILFAFILCFQLAQSQERYGGLALYTVRDAMAKDPMLTLKKVAAIGYKNVEAAGYKELLKSILNR